jgi:hypothetical protein
MARSVFATVRTPKARFSDLHRANGMHSSEERETENSIVSVKYDCREQSAVASCSGWPSIRVQAKAPSKPEGPSLSSRG